MELKKFNEYLRYDKRTGKLFWNKKIKRLPKLENKEAGHIHKNKNGKRSIFYRRFRLFGKNYSSHRIIWYLHYGYMPNVIDHIDGNGLNNKITNLRDVTASINQKNRYTHRAGRLYGAIYYKPKNNWMSVKIIGKKRIFLGYYKTEEEAHIAYLLFENMEALQSVKG